MARRPRPSPLTGCPASWLPRIGASSCSASDPSEQEHANVFKQNSEHHAHLPCSCSVAIDTRSGLLCTPRSFSLLCTPRLLVLWVPIRLTSTIRMISSMSCLSSSRDANTPWLQTTTSTGPASSSAHATAEASRTSAAWTPTPTRSSRPESRWMSSRERRRWRGRRPTELRRRRERQRTDACFLRKTGHGPCCWAQTTCGGGGAPGLSAGPFDGKERQGWNDCRM